MDELHLLRLYRLADMLENFTKQKNKLRIPGDGHITKFNMTTWGCDTSACALGSAALLPEFSAAGLQTRPSEDWLASDDERHENRYVVFVDPETGAASQDSVDAGAEFFGITQDESHDLFMVTHEKDDFGRIRKGRPLRPRQVAKKVRALIDKYEEWMYGGKDVSPEVPSAPRR